MSTRKALRAGLVLGLPLAALAMLGWSAGNSTISGTFSVRYAEQHPVAVPDAAGHNLVIGRAQGVNRSTGPTPYMGGGAVTNYEFADLTQGNGPQQGYIAMSQGTDSVISKWSGKVTTTLSTDKRPSTTMKGTWTTVRGTGRYRDVAGSGTYEGRFTSETEYRVDWKGELSGGGLADR